MLARMATPEFPEVVRALARGLRRDSDRWSGTVAARLAERIPEYSPRGPVPREDLRNSCLGDVDQLLAVMAGERPLTPGSTARTGRRRARQGIGHASLMSGYRVCMRMVWDGMVAQALPEQEEALLRSGADVWAVSDELIDAASEAYLETRLDQTRQEVSRRSATVAALLDGGASFEAASPDGADLGLVGSRFQVLALSAGSPSDVQVREAQSAFARHPGTRAAWRYTSSGAEGIVAIGAGVSGDGLLASLSELVSGSGGISDGFDSLLQTAEASRQARVALRCCTPRERDLRSYRDSLVQSALVAAPREAERLGALMSPLLHDGRESTLLSLDVLRHWLAREGDLSDLAGELSMHRNTIRSHLHRVEALTGLRLHVPAEAAVVHAAYETTRMNGTLPACRIHSTGTCRL